MASVSVKTVLYTDITSWVLDNSYSIKVAVCFVFSVWHLDAQASCHRNCTSSIAQACSSQYAFISLPSVCRRTVMLDKMQHQSLWQQIFFQCIAVWSACVTHTLVWQLQYGMMWLYIMYIHHPCYCIKVSPITFSDGWIVFVGAENKIDSLQANVWWSKGICHKTCPQSPNYLLL